MKILFKLPSRGRKDRFFQALDSIVNNLQDTENYHIAATLDTDDEIMNNEDVFYKLAEYKNLSVQWGASKNKIDAVNRSIPDISWDVIVICSDDIFFNIYGFDTMIRQEMQGHFPEGDGYLHFNEKDSGVNLNVMTVCDRKYYERFNYIYHPEYLSLFADNEQFEVAKMLKRYVYIPYSIMVHKNPAYSEYGMERDELFNQQQEIGWTIDQETFNRRKAKNFDLHEAVTVNINPNSSW